MHSSSAWALAASSLAARASSLRFSELCQHPDLSPHLCRILLKVQKASAFMADGGLGVLHLSSRSISAHSVARHLLWLRTSNVELASESNLVSAPFADGKLLRDQALQEVLVDTHDQKRAMLAYSKKDDGKHRNFS